MASPRSIARWAAMLMKGAEAVPALVLPEAIPAKPTGKAQSAANITSNIRPNIGPTITVEERLQSLTDAARKLVGYLSAVPLQMPVMRLVQRVMLPDSRIEHLAEVMLSGLIKRSHPEQEVAARAEDEIDFDFISQEVRDDRVRELRFGELDAVVRCVSDYVSDRIGRRCDLRTLIEDSEGAITVLPEALPFAASPPAPWPCTASIPKPCAAIPSKAEETDGSRSLLSTSPPSRSTRAATYSNANGRRPLTARQFIEELGGGVRLEMVEVPGGTFLMGSPDGEAERYPDEGPQHPVSVPPFYIGKFTVTQAQWRIVASWEKIEHDLNPDPSHFKGDDRRLIRLTGIRQRNFAGVLPERPATHIACPPKLNGNTPAGLEPPPLSLSAKPSPRSS